MDFLITRRRLAVIPAVDGSVLPVYQGSFPRRAAVSAGLWPAVAYGRRDNAPDDHDRPDNNAAARAIHWHVVTRKNTDGFRNGGAARPSQARI